MSEPSSELKALGLDALVRQLDDAVGLFDRCGKLLLTNRWELLPAERASEPMGDLGDLFQIFHPDGGRYEPGEWPLLRSLKTGEVIVDEQFFSVASDGSRRHFSMHCAPFRDDDGRIAGAASVTRDVTDQKRAHDRLTYLLPLLDHTEDAIIAFDPHWRTTAWNRGAERMYGWSAEEALGRELRSFMRLDMSDRQHTELRREIAERGRWRGEVDVGRKDGSLVSVESINVAVRDSNGEITGYLAIHRNVTERKRAEEAEREANRRAESSLEHISDAFVAVDTDWRYTYLNEPALNSARIAHGAPLTRGDLLGKNCWEAFPELVGTTFDRELHAALVQQKAVRFEAYSPRTDSWLEVQAYTSKDGLSIYSRDATERRRAEEQLRYHASLLNNVEDGVIATDADDFRVTAWNRGAERLYGFSADEVLGRPAREVASFPGDEARLKLERELLETGRTRIEFRARRKDGSPIEVELIAVAVEDERGDTTGHLGIHRDITERKRAEEQLRYHASLLDNMDDAVLGTDAEFVLTAWNGGAERMFGWTAAEALGHKVYELIPTSFSDEAMAAQLGDLVKTGRWRGGGTWYGKDGEGVEAEGLTVATRSESGQTRGYVCIMRNVARRRRTELELERGLRQQAAVAELGLKALAGEPLSPLMDAAVTVVCRTLGVEYAKVDQLLADSEELVVSAGAGWGEGTVGIHRIPADRHSSPAGYALSRGEPVIVEDMAAETRFEVPPILGEHGVLSDVTVVIGRRENPFGTLAALSKKRRAFSEHDVSFVQSVANVLATAVARQGSERMLETTAREQALLADLSVRALAGNNLEELLADSVTLVADMLAVELSSIAQAGAGGELSWRAAFGWTKDELANAPASRAGTGSLVGYTISVGEPVVSDDVNSDKRFGISATFAERAPVSAAAVVIPGPRDPYGALVVAAQAQRTFGPAELEFMQAVANVIGIAVDRAHDDERIDAARGAERSRIARDLHDEALRELTDALAVATMARSSAASDQDARRWDALVTTLQRGTRQLRSAIYDLRLSGDGERPLADLLSELVAIQADLAADGQLQLHGREALGSVSVGDAGTEVLRIVTEALTNARRHSGAATIRVDASASSTDVLRLEVSDDGAWPDRESAVRTKRGTGIASMFHRADALGAELRIRGRAEGGTTVSLELPGRLGGAAM